MEDNEKSLIEQANIAAQRMEEANKIKEALIIREEKLEARRLLGGQAEAGHVAPVVSEEDKTKADMMNYFKGSAIERALKNANQ
jgi:hypothetical protein